MHTAGMALIHYYTYILLSLPTLIIIFIMYFSRRHVPHKKTSLETGALNVKGPTGDAENLDGTHISVCSNLIFIKDVKFIKPGT
jgi:ABC-type arginine transport system permease subunit